MSRKCACPDLCIFFISASPEQSEITLVEKLQRRENCQSIMFDEERLDPHAGFVRVLDNLESSGIFFAIFQLWKVLEKGHWSWKVLEIS